MNNTMLLWTWSGSNTRLLGVHNPINNQCFVRTKGLEPIPPLQGLEPKSSAATNYATSATYKIKELSFHYNKHSLFCEKKNKKKENFAGQVGFEPTITAFPPSGFGDLCLRPLGH